MTNIKVRPLFLWYFIVTLVFVIVLLPHATDDRVGDARMAEIGALARLGATVMAERPVTAPCKCDRIEALATRIATREGWYRDSLPRRLNNPGALVYAGQRYAIVGRRGFAYFDTAAHGWAALERDLNKKFGRGMTRDQIWQTWTDGLQ